MLHPKGGSAALAAALLATLPLAAPPADQPTYKVDVSVVNVLASVRDRNGKIVTNLNKEDFILEEDGVRQEVRYFARQTDLPLTIGLLVDTSMSQARLIETERRASLQFLRDVLRPDLDLAFLIKFDVEVELLQDLTGSPKLLEEALALLRTPRPGLRRNAAPSSRLPSLPESSWFQLPGGSPFPVPGGGRRPRGDGQQPGPGGRRGGLAGVGTALYDAVFLASDEILQKQSGRKTVLLISDGVDAGSKVRRDTAIAAAQRADTIVYGIRYYDPEAYSLGGRGRGQQAAGAYGTEILKSLSSQTGGHMFEAGKQLSLEQIFRDIQEELRNQYSLGYTPPPGAAGGFRHIKLTTRDRSLKVQTREGYYYRGS